MTIRLPGVLDKRSNARVPLLLVAVSFLSLSLGAAAAHAQKKGFTRKYPASENVRLVLRNTYGTIEVEAWNRNEIKVSANMDSPVARITPQQTDGALEINVAQDNRGRDDVGDVNFKIWVPASSTVDIETKRGQITVSGVQGALVRAHIWLSGDISLTDIRAARVMAVNGMGDILFDGELLSGGNYEIKSRDGNINIRIPANSVFTLSAAAPMSRRITLGSFSNAGLKFVGDGRKVTGSVGGGGALLTITNYKGSISFIPR
jgi:hypothetical protein